MKRRARAIAFAIGALACAGLSAAVAGGSGSAGAQDYGELRDVVVTTAPLEKGQTISPRTLDALLVERRVPEAFVPPDVLGLPGEALGRRFAMALPAGSYVTQADFASIGSGRPPGTATGPSGTTPVEIEVIGAGALAATRTAPGDEVDVVISGAATPGPTTHRTYVAAEGVELLSLREAAAEPGLEDGRYIATLALTRGQALDLIRAESEAAQVRLLAG